MQPRDWWLIALWAAVFASLAAGTALGVQAAWPSRHTALGDDTTATYLRMALYWTVMATVLIALTRLVVGRLNRLCVKVKGMSGLLQDMMRDDEPVRALEDATAAAIAAAQQLELRSAQIVRGLDRLQQDRVAEGEARDARDTALIASMDHVVGMAMKDLGSIVEEALRSLAARISVVEHAQSATANDLTHRVDRVEVTARTSAVEHAARLAALERESSQRPEPAAPSDNGNGNPSPGVLAMPNSQAVELGRRLERKKMTNGNGDQDAGA